MTHLILHKVRGEAAFDVAIQLEDSGTDSDPGPWWIIPTSGHRAYPYRIWELNDLADISDIGADGFHDRPVDFHIRDIENWPDHYEIDKGQAPSPSFNIMSVISPMMRPFKRRL